jgi:hypothetical protein
MSETTHLLLPYLAAAQAQKHVTHNEALRLLDGLVQLAVLDRTRTAPPPAPADGDRHIVASGATGLWTGWDLNVAFWVDGAWTRLVPREGWLAWVADEDLLLGFDGNAWVVTGGGGVSLADLADGAADLLGVNTAADGINRLAVRSNNALLTAVSVGDGGTGSARQVVNKEAVGDTASVLFQTSFSGRAEVGTVGSDGLLVRVSPDGSSWLTGFAVPSTGQLCKGSDVNVPIGSRNAAIQVHGTDFHTSTLAFGRWTTDAFGPELNFQKVRASLGGSGGLSANDQVGVINFWGNNGEINTSAAQISVSTVNSWASNPGAETGQFAVVTRAAGAATSRLLVRGNDIRFPQLSTTASAGNAFLDPANQNNLLRSTSSLQFKRDVEDIEPARAEAVLGLRPIWYRSRAEADDPNWSWYGLAAEEVAEVDPRLVHWGYRDEDYEDRVIERDLETGLEVVERTLKPDARLVPDGVQYDRLAVLLLGVVKRQEARIAALEARVAAMDVPPREDGSA